MRYAMVIDMDACVGCMNCVVACKTENSVPPGLRRDWVTETERGEYPDTRLEIHSERCNHCEKPPCVPVCPTGANKRRKDGIVAVDRAECIACGACVDACPYGARFLHPDGYASGCTYCLHLVEQGLDPACVASCPVSCMTFGDLDDPSSAVNELLRTRAHHVLKPEAGSRPQGYYLS